MAPRLADGLLQTLYRQHKIYRLYHLVRLGNSSLPSTEGCAAKPLAESYAKMLLSTNNVHSHAKRINLRQCNPLLTATVRSNFVRQADKLCTHQASKAGNHTQPFQAHREPQLQPTLLSQFSRCLLRHLLHQSRWTGSALSLNVCTAECWRRASGLLLAEMPLRAMSQAGQQACTSCGFLQKIVQHFHIAAC